MKLTDHTGLQRQIKSAGMLKDILAEYQSLEEVVIILDSSEHGSLTIGVGKTYGFVEFIKPDAIPPYLIATNIDKRTLTSKEILTFNSGGTDTPIPQNLCISMDFVGKIALEFYKHKNLPTFVDWVEV